MAEEPHQRAPAARDYRALRRRCQIAEPGFLTTESRRRSDGPDPSGVNPAPPHPPRSAWRPLPAARGEVSGQSAPAGPSAKAISRHALARRNLSLDGPAVARV